MRRRNADLLRDIHSSAEVFNMLTLYIICDLLINVSVCHDDSFVIYNITLRITNLLSGVSCERDLGLGDT